jgi:hypothetical protein
MRYKQRVFCNPMPSDSFPYTQEAVNFPSNSLGRASALDSAVSPELSSCRGGFASSAAPRIAQVSRSYGFRPIPLPQDQIGSPRPPRDGQRMSHAFGCLSGSTSVSTVRIACATS